jgi:hypothetical protein
MSLAVDLPEILLIQILSVWLTDKDVMRLDTSFCSKSLREYLLALFADSCMFIHCQTDNSPLSWAYVRQIKLSAISLYQNNFTGFHSLQYISSLRLSELKLSHLSEFDFFRVINSSKKLDHVQFNNLDCFTPEAINRININLFVNIKVCHIETLNTNSAQAWIVQMLKFSNNLIEFSLKFENSLLEESSILNLIGRNSDLLSLELNGAQLGNNGFFSGLFSEPFIGITLLELELTLNCFDSTEHTLQLVALFFRHFQLLQYLDMNTETLEFYVLYDKTGDECSFAIDSNFAGYDNDLLCILDELNDLSDISIFNSGLGKDILLKIQTKFCHSLKYARLQKHLTTSSPDVFGFSKILDSCKLLKTLFIMNSKMTDDDFFQLSTISTQLINLLISENSNLTDETAKYWCDLCDETLETFSVETDSITRFYRPFGKIQGISPGRIWPF